MIFTPIIPKTVSMFLIGFLLIMGCGYWYDSTSVWTDKIVERIFVELREIRFFFTGVFVLWFGTASLVYGDSYWTTGLIGVSSALLLSFYLRSKFHSSYYRDHVVIRHHYISKRAVVSNLSELNDNTLKNFYNSIRVLSIFLPATFRWFVYHEVESELAERTNRKHADKT